MTLGTDFSRLACCSSFFVGWRIDWPTVCHRISQRTVKHTRQPSYELSLYTGAGLLEFMPHVVTTRHDLLINHVFAIQSITIVPPDTVAIVAATVHVRRWLRTKAAGVQTCSEPEPEPLRPVVSARLALADSGAHAAATRRRSVGRSVCLSAGCLSGSFHRTSTMFPVGFVG